MYAPLAHRSRILGTGHFLPECIRTNADLAKMVDTSDAWITERTGIKTRHIAPAGMTTSDMAASAGAGALAAAGIKASELDMIIVGTVTPDHPMPATAVYVQRKLGAGTCPAFDLSAACAGFLFGLSIADQFIRTGAQRYVLVIGVELLSSIVNWQDRTTCVIFGDGAGAVVLGPSKDEPHSPPRGVLSTGLFSDGSFASSLIVPAGGSAMPLTQELFEQKKHKVFMKGQDVFKAAVKNLVSASKRALEEASMSNTDIDWMCAHQANRRILDQVVARLAIPKERVLVNIDRVGNTSSASIPILLDENIRSGVIKPGHTVLMCALGAGISWASALIRL